MIIGFALFILSLLVLWHFVVEAIIAPSARATLRLRLFAIRDKVRSLRISETITEAEFDESQRRVNNIIRIIPNIDVFGMVEWEIKAKQNKELAEKLARREKEFEELASPQVKELNNEATKIALAAIRANSLGWFVYLVPIAIGFICWARASREIKKLSGATEHELDSSGLCAA